MTSINIQHSVGSSCINYTFWEMFDYLRATKYMCACVCASSFHTHNWIMRRSNIWQHVSSLHYSCRSVLVNLEFKKKKNCKAQQARLALVSVKGVFMTLGSFVTLQCPHHSRCDFLAVPAFLEFSLFSLFSSSLPSRRWLPLRRADNELENKRTSNESLIQFNCVSWNLFLTVSSTSDR